MEQLLRVISWTVVLGAVFALAYAGLKPVLKEHGFPPVDESQVGGAVLAPADELPDEDNRSGALPPPERQFAAADCDGTGDASERCPPNNP